LGTRAVGDLHAGGLGGALMRVATWNCAGQIEQKWAALDALDADLVIIQECGPGSPQMAREHGWQGLWTGTGSKGLGLFARPGWALEQLPHDEQWWLPARVTGPVEFTLIGFWALPPKVAQQTYTRQATMTGELLAKMTEPLVLGGDFNAWDHPAHLRLMQTMANQGRPSAYHRDRGCARNAEPDPTYFHLWKHERQHHIDLLFTPAEWAVDAVEIGTYVGYTASRISDHVPVVARLATR
jgi:exodeoxyribonuclease-3